MSLIIILPLIIILAICSIPLIAGFILYAWTDPIYRKFTGQDDIFDGNS